MINHRCFQLLFIIVFIVVTVVCVSPADISEEATVQGEKRRGIEVAG